MTHRFNAAVVSMTCAAATAFSLALPAGIRAQDHFPSQCATAGAGRSACERAVQAVQIVQPRIGIAASGGNPVPGSASTLGMRLGTLPRISVGARATAAMTELPPIESFAGGEELKFAVPSINADASVGIFSGLSLAPTIGGFGSIDALASFGMIPVPDGEGFSSGSPKTWALGARVGLLRESFTAPGISVSGMYRKIGDVTYGDSTSSEVSFAMEDMSAISLRAAISKRLPLIGLGATAGVGYDKYEAAARIAVRDPSFGGFGFRTQTDDLGTDRKSAFVNLSWTLLVLNIAGEVGWQEGGEAPAGATISAEPLEKAGYFASLALRIAL